jgi:hypothetical protein
MTRVGRQTKRAMHVNKKEIERKRIERDREAEAAAVLCLSQYFRHHQIVCLLAQFIILKPNFVGPDNFNLDSDRK